MDALVQRMRRTWARRTTPRYTHLHLAHLIPPRHKTAHHVVPAAPPTCRLPSVTTTTLSRASIAVTAHGAAAAAGCPATAKPAPPPCPACCCRCFVRRSYSCGWAEARNRCTVCRATRTTCSVWVPAGSHEYTEHDKVVGPFCLKGVGDVYCVCGGGYKGTRAQGLSQNSMTAQASDFVQAS